MSNLQMKRLWRKESHHRLHRLHKLYAWKTFVWFTEHGIHDLHFNVVGTRKIHRKYITLAIKNQPRESVISTYEIARTYLEDRKHVKYSSDFKNLISLIEKPTAWIDISTKLRVNNSKDKNSKTSRLTIFYSLKYFNKFIS